MINKHDWIMQMSESDYDEDEPRHWACRNCPASIVCHEDDLPDDDCLAPQCPACEDWVTKDEDWDYAETGAMIVQWECQDCGHEFETEVPTPKYMRKRAR